MSRLVYCVKLQKEAPGLKAPPYPGELGQRIFKSISEEAFTAWLQHQTILINENRLQLSKAQDRAFLQTAMKAFFFGENAA